MLCRGFGLRAFSIASRDVKTLAGSRQFWGRRERVGGHAHEDSAAPRRSAPDYGKAAAIPPRDEFLQIHRSGAFNLSGLSTEHYRFVWENGWAQALSCRAARHSDGEQTSNDISS